MIWSFGKNEWDSNSIRNVRIAFVSLRDNLDLSTPSGRLMFQIIGAMCNGRIREFERALIQERVKAGLRNARVKGKATGPAQSPERTSAKLRLLLCVLQASGASEHHCVPLRTSSESVWVRFTDLVDSDTISRAL